MRVVWVLVLVACVGMAGFIVFLTVTNPELPPRGFIIAAVLLGIGLYPLQRLRDPAAPSG